MRAAWVALALVACSKPDDGRLRAAKARYDALLEASTPPSAASWGELLVELDALGAAGAPLARAVRASREVPVRAPLVAVPRQGSRPPEVQAQREACVRLAQALGRDGGVSAEVVRALDACREQAERLDAHAH